MKSSLDSIALLVGLGFPDDDSLELRFPPDYSDEILGLLDDNGIEHDTALEMSDGPTEWIEVVRVLGPAVTSVGGLAGLAAVIKVFVHRHDGKQVILKRGEYETMATGYSEKKTLQFLKELQEKQAASDTGVEKVPPEFGWH